MNLLICQININEYTTTPDSATFRTDAKSLRVIYSAFKVYFRSNQTVMGLFIP